MTPPSPIAMQNCQVLRQMADILETIDDELFSRAAPPAFSSGAGSHLRHALDHYQSFLDGMDRGCIDYENRGRDLRLEQDVHFAMGRIEAVMSGLRGLTKADEDRPVTVQVERGLNGGGAPNASSSMRRELDFLLSHTIHHYALIHVLLQLHGFSTPEGFGTAPSTLRHQRRNARLTG